MPVSPRNRYDIRIYPTFLHLHGKTFDYKIPYTTVLRLFLLPHKDQRQMFFVVSVLARLCFGNASVLLYVCVCVCGLSEVMINIEKQKLAVHWRCDNCAGFSPRSAWIHPLSRDRLAIISSSCSSPRRRTSLSPSTWASEWWRIVHISHSSEPWVDIQFLLSFPPSPSLHCREDVEKRFEGKLSKSMSGSLYEMVSRVMKALVNRKITVPGNFQG